jgi:hypothetical protein
MPEISSARSVETPVGAFDCAGHAGFEPMMLGGQFVLLGAALSIPPVMIAILFNASSRNGKTPEDLRQRGFSFDKFCGKPDGF